LPNHAPRRLCRRSRSECPSGAFALHDVHGLARDFRWHLKAKNWLKRPEPLLRGCNISPAADETIACAIVAFRNSHTTAFEVIMIAQLVKYLRESVQSCVDLARACPHLSTSQGLEELATDLMAKATELDNLNMD
jgi:hypothetical protein